MNARPFVLALIAAAFLQAEVAAAARATPTLPALDALAANIASSALPVASGPVTAALVAPDVAPSAPSLATTSGLVLEAVRWRPRRWREPRRASPGRGAEGLSQIHAGFQDPDGDVSASFLAGFRGGAGIDEHIQLGLGLDWVRKSDRSTVIVSDVPLPGGGTSERRLELARSSSNLFPMMAFVQVTPGDVGVLPYFGIGGGYEVLFLSAEDFQSGTEFDATYGGWGWQAWAGVAIPLSGKARLFAEVFRNTADVERDVDDAPSGQSYREIVNVDGTGMRFGLGWGF